MVWVKFPVKFCRIFQTEVFSPQKFFQVKFFHPSFIARAWTGKYQLKQMAPVGPGAGTDHQFLRMGQPFDDQLHVAFRHARFLGQTFDRGKGLAPVIGMVSNGQEQEQVDPYAVNAPRHGS